MCHNVYVMMHINDPVPLFGAGDCLLVAGFFLLIPSITILQIANTVLRKDVKPMKQIIFNGPDCPAQYTTF